MTSTKITTSEKTERKKRTYHQINLSAQDKVQAVLAVWTERCKPAEVCRQLNINWITFNHYTVLLNNGIMKTSLFAKCIYYICCLCMATVFLSGCNTNLKREIHLAPPMKL
jgi:hypothetical protein